MIIRSIVSFQKWNILLAFGAIYFTALAVSKVSCEESVTSLTEPEWRKNSQRKPRQDDDDDDEPLTGADILNSQVVSTLSQIYAAVPEVVNMFTRFSTAVNNNLNDTDTPSIGSFLFRQGTNVVQLFQSLTGQMNQHGQSQNEMQLSPSVISGFNLSSLSQLRPAPLINPWPTIAPTPPTTTISPPPPTTAIASPPLPPPPSSSSSSLNGHGSIPLGLAETLQQFFATRLTSPSDWDVDYHSAEEEKVVQPWPPVVAPVSSDILKPGIGTHSVNINNSTSPTTSYGQIQENDLESGAMPVEPHHYVGTPLGLSLWNIYKSFHGRHPGDFQVILNTLQLLTAPQVEEMMTLFHNKNMLEPTIGTTVRPASVKPNQMSLWNMYNKMHVNNMISISKPLLPEIPSPPPSPKTLTRVPTRWVVRPSLSPEITSARPTQVVAQLVKSSTTSVPASPKPKPSAMIKNTILAMPMAEKLNPKFTPGKPAYWMNMYYPDGIPVMTKVLTTKKITTTTPATKSTVKSRIKNLLNKTLNRKTG